MKRCLSLLFAVLALSSSAQDRTDPQQYEKILIPLYTSQEGAFGARWQTELLIWNDSDRAVDVFPLTRDCISSSACFQHVREAPALLPHDRGFHTFGVLGPIGTHNGMFGNGLTPGVFIYAERAGVEGLRFQLHVADTARRPAALGTAVPVVREREFFTGLTSMQGIPVREQTRIALRIYELDPQGPASVRIRIHETAAVPTGGSSPDYPRQNIAEEVVQFLPPPENTCGFALGCPAGFGYKPGYIEINDLVGRYPELATVTGRPYGIRIEIEPLTAGHAFWPMVSVTDVNSSVVTVYTAR